MSSARFLVALCFAILPAPTHGNPSFEGTASTGAMAVDTIVVDPGHGGANMGCFGAGGVFEKTVTLSMAETIKETIEASSDITVILTRHEDEDLSLAERSASANQEGADLFISLHLNATKDTSVQGIETYFLASTATDAMALALAKKENGSEGALDTSGVSSILGDMTMQANQELSQFLAKQIQFQLVEHLGGTDRGVKQAPFGVLKGACMPAVVMEVGFLTNVEEGGRLLLKETHELIAEALLDAIEGYDSLAAQ